MQQNSLIGKADGVRHLHNSSGNTHDIINTIMYADGFCAPYTVNLSRALADKDLKTTCYNIWKFWKDHVKYVEDPDGYQFVKSPGYLFEVGKTEGGDCKSYSVAVASCLKNLGIKYAYRFITEDARKEFHHVYVAVPSPSGEIIIDCVLDDFNQENKYEKKRDIMPTAKNKIGAPAITVTDTNWVTEVNDYRANIESIKANVKERLKNGIRFQFASQAVRRNKGLKMIDDNWAQLLDSSISMIYHFWDSSQAQFPGAYYGSTAVNNATQIFGNLTAKKDFGLYLYDALTAIGCREGDIRDLCSLSVFNVYGIPLNYMLYRCYNMVNYGQPWKPVAGVPYWDYNTNSFKANGATNDDILLIAFALPYGGGVGRPYGQPYWAAGGWVMPNGASDAEAAKFAQYNPQPNNVHLNSETVNRSMNLYSQWINGNMASLPKLPGYDKLRNRPGAISGKHAIGDGLGVTAIVSIVVACITALSVITGIVANIIAMIKKQPAPNQISEPVADFKQDYQTVDGCYIGSAPAECGAQKAKYCANGSFTCLTDVQLALPENKPAAGSFGGGAPGKNTWLMIAGIGLIGIGLLSGSKST